MARNRIAIRTLKMISSPSSLLHCRYRPADNRENHNTIGLKSRLENARTAAWMNSTPLRCFLSHALDYLEGRSDESRGTVPGGHELIAHFLMGKATIWDLPREFEKYANCITPEIQAELHDLLRTHRHKWLCSSESPEKTRDKLTELLNHALDQVKGWLDHGCGVAEEDIVLLLKEGALAQDQALRLLGSLSSEAIQPLAWQRFAEDPAAFRNPDKFHQALLDGLARPRNAPCELRPGNLRPSGLEMLIRTAFHRSPTDERRLVDREDYANLKQALLNAVSQGALGKHASYLLEDMMLGYPLLWHAPVLKAAQDGLRERYPDLPLWNEAGAEALHYARSHVDGSVVRSVLEDSRQPPATDPELMQALLASKSDPQHWRTQDAEIFFLFCRDQWNDIRSEYRPALAKLIARLIEAGKLPDSKYWMEDIARFFDQEGFPIDQMDRPFAFHASIFDKAQRPMLDFFRRNMKHFLQAEGENNRNTLASGIYHALCVLPPTHQQLDARVETQFQQRLKFFKSRGSALEEKRMQQTLRSGSYDQEIRPRIQARLEKILSRHNFPISRGSYRQELLHLACGRLSLPEYRNNRIKDTLHKALIGQSYSPKAIDKLEKELLALDYRTVAQEWFKEKFPIHHVHNAFDVFWEFLDWKIKIEDEASAEAANIAKALEACDAAMKHYPPGLFASYVLATLPYRSGNNIDALINDWRGDPRFASALRAVPHSGDDDPCHVMFVGFEGNANDSAPLFLRVEALSLLNPRSIEPQNRTRFHLGRSDKQNPLQPEDVWNLALPKYLWEPMTAKFAGTGSIVAKRLEELVLKMANTQGSALSEPQERLLRSAVGYVVSPNADFQAGTAEKKSLRENLGDTKLEEQINTLIVAISNENAKGTPLFECLAQTNRPPHANQVDEGVKALQGFLNVDAGIAYYCLGVLLTRLSSVDGLGYHNLANDENQSIVGLRLLGAYGLAQARKHLGGASQRTKEAIDKEIQYLVLRHDCAAQRASLMHGPQCTPSLADLSRQVNRLLNAEIPLGRRQRNAPPELPDFGGGQPREERARPSGMIVLPIENINEA
ncbi:MAG TPA: hypothetical protein VEC35_19345 [Noviherbaspirillum sp.]|nr:hypothetical protein [Noviherbaspirillum sp.]